MASTPGASPESLHLSLGPRLSHPWLEGLASEHKPHGLNRLEGGMFSSWHGRPLEPCLRFRASQAAPQSLPASRPEPGLHTICTHWWGPRGWPCQSGLALPLLVVSNYLWWPLSPLGVGQVVYPAEPQCLHHSWSQEQAVWHPRALPASVGTILMLKPV